MSNGRKIAGKWRHVNHKLPDQTRPGARGKWKRMEIMFSLVAFFRRRWKVVVNPQERRRSRAGVVAWQENAALREGIRRQELRALTEEEAERLFAEMSVLDAASILRRLLPLVTLMKEPGHFRTAPGSVAQTNFVPL